jgi:hypothetical protein
LFALAACDRALNLGATAAADGALVFFDAPTTTGCPPPGVTPRYTHALVQDFEQQCVSYTVSTTLGIAVAVCFDATGQQFTAEGPLDQPLVAADGLDDPLCQTFDAQIGADGTVSVTCISMVTFLYEHRSFTKQNGTWTRGVDVLAATPTYLRMTPVTQTTPQHLVYFDVSDFALHELVGSPSAWTGASAMPIATLGAKSLSWISISSDGLRMTVLGDTPTDSRTAVLFTDRSQLGDAFRALSTPDGVPAADSVYMTDDCSRVYVTGLSSVWFVDELKQ